jgi:hypothetical protein
MIVLVKPVSLKKSNAKPVKRIILVKQPVKRIVLVKTVKPVSLKKSNAKPVKPVKKSNAKTELSTGELNSSIN